MMREMLFPG